MNKLKSFLNTHNLQLTDKQNDEFQSYLELIEQYQKKTNLVGPKTTDKIIDELFIDSLYPLTITPTIPSPLLDIGTGAGFPAIPLKIMQPSLDLILVEPRTKRAAFLNILKSTLKLTNTIILNDKIDNLQNLNFNAVISKAFEPLDKWLQRIKPWILQNKTAYVLCATSDWEQLSSQWLSENKQIQILNIYHYQNRAVLALHLNSKTIDHL